jgi:hypothetical protein
MDNRRQKPFHQGCQPFSVFNIPNREKFTKLPTNIPSGQTNIPNGQTNIPNGQTNIPNGQTNIPNGRKYTNVFHCKTLQNLPKSGFLV